MAKLRLMVVDDSPVMLRLLKIQLEELGHLVIRTAATGRDAITAYKACRPDLVTMDITIPGMDGIEATRLILKEYPDAKIIMVTSYGHEKMVLDALKAGAKGYVLKPFKEHLLYQAIQNACNITIVHEKLQSEIEQRTVQTDTAEIDTEKEAEIEAEKERKAIESYYELTTAAAKDARKLSRPENAE